MYQVLTSRLPEYLKRKTQVWLAASKEIFLPVISFSSNKHFTDPTKLDNPMAATQDKKKDNPYPKEKKSDFTVLFQITTILFLANCHPSTLLKDRQAVKPLTTNDLAWNDKRKKDLCVKDMSSHNSASSSQQNGNSIFFLLMQCNFCIWGTGGGLLIALTNGNDGEWRSAHPLCLTMK